MYGRSRVLQIANMWYLGERLSLGTALLTFWIPGQYGILPADSQHPQPWSFVSDLSLVSADLHRWPYVLSFCSLYLVCFYRFFWLRQFEQIGGGLIADCWRAEERGRAIALFSLAPLLGPVVGPIAGAWIAQKSTWKWVVSNNYFRALYERVDFIWVVLEHLDRRWCHSNPWNSVSPGK